MSDKTKYSGAVTAQHDFCRANSNGDRLFSVRSGVPLSAAFDKLTLLVANASAVMGDIGIAASTDESSSSAHAGVELLDIAYALIQSMHQGQNEFENARSKP